MPILSEKKTFYHFALIAFLVIALTAIFSIGFFRQKSSRQLSSSVKELVGVHTDIARIDGVIQSMYAAENYFRFYTLTYERSYYNKYTAELNSIAVQLDSLSNADKESSDRLQALLVNKEKRASIFVKVKQMTDSLLLFSQKIDSLQPAAISLAGARSLLPHTRTRTDTIITVAPQSGRKKLFGRIKDAISNKPTKQTSQKIIRSSIDSSSGSTVAESQQLRKLQQYYDQHYKNAVRNHRNLNQKEYEMVMANENLFKELQHQLSALKSEELAAADKRRIIIGENIDQTIYKLDRNALWMILLMLVLLAFIFYSIIRLYRNDRRLLQAKKEAERFAKLKSEFIATLSHEIRTPLNSLVGYSEYLAKSSLPQEQVETVDAIKLSSDMLLSVVNNILDFSRMETNRLQLSNAAFSPREVIEGVAKGLRIQAQKKELTLITHVYFSGAIKLKGDSFRLKQIVVNLVGNAIKFTSKGSITISATLQHDGDKRLLKVAVADTGIGIAPDDLPIIFEEFTQAGKQKDRAERHEGSGLGLYIIKKIIDLHKGKITVQSTPGKGSEFRFEIPYPAADGPSGSDNAIKPTIPNSNTDMTTPQHPASTSGQPGEKPVLLVAEDNVLNRKMLAMILDQAGYPFTLAADGREALDLFRQHKFDMVLTDIDMPTMDGITLTSEIRRMQDDIKSVVPILAITGNVLDEDLVQYTKAGVDGFIFKPYRLEEVTEKIVQFNVLKTTKS